MIFSKSKQNRLDTDPGRRSFATADRISVCSVERRDDRVVEGGEENTKWTGLPSASLPSNTSHPTLDQTIANSRFL